MTRRRPRPVRRLTRRRALRGFSLFEVLVAVALTGLVLGLLGTVTAQWLPSWNYGFARLQRADLVTLAAERIAADLAAAEFVSLDPKSQRATFEGTPSSVVFVRSSLGPNATDGLEIIRIAEEEEGKGFALVRSRAAFGLHDPRDGATGVAFSNKVALLHSPIRVHFAFADASRQWLELWRDKPTLPSAVRITISDAAKRNSFSVTTDVALRMSLAPVCIRAVSVYGCVEEFGRRGSVTLPTEAQGQQNPERER